MARPTNGRATRFRPGVSGNPKGRPKGASARSIVREVLAADGGEALRRWVRSILDEPKAAPVVLDVLRWLDGANPADDPGEARVDSEADRRPRIVIPDLPPWGGLDDPAPC